MFGHNHSCKTNKTDYQINGRKNIQLYKSLFEQERFEELENLFEINTKRNYISFRFNFSFERFIFHNNNYFYLIRCINNNKQKDYNNNENSDLNLHSLCNNQIIKDKIISLLEINEIDELEKELFESHIKNFLDLTNLNFNLKKNLKQNYHNIKFNSKVHGDNVYENSIIDENSSQNFGLSFNSNISKLSKIIESRNKILQNEITSNKIIYLKILLFLLLINAILFVFIYNQLYTKSKEKLDFIREYNNLLFSTKIIMIRIVNKVLDYSVLFYVKLYKYNIILNYGYSSENEFIIDSKRKAKIWYNESMVKINYLERYILDIIKEPINKVWFKIYYDYQIKVPWNDSDYFPVIIKSSLYNAYYLFSAENLFQFDDINLISDNYFIVSYTTYNSINGIIKYILPNLISFIPKLLDHYLNYSNNLFFLFQIILFFYTFIFFFFFFGIGIITFLSISQFNMGITKVTKISQDNVENIILKFKKFKINLNEIIHLNKINSYDNNNKNSIEENKSDSDKSINANNNNDLNIEKTKNFRFYNKDISININKNNNTFSLDRQTLKKISFQRFIILYFTISLLFTAFFIIVFYYIPIYLIQCNSYLLKSHSYILENFLFTTTYLFKMKSLFANYTKIKNLNLNNNINKLLSNDLFDSLPKFKDFNAFYYNAFLLNACLALYEEKSENYTNCLNIEIIHSINNTNAFKNYIIKK